MRTRLKLDFWLTFLLVLIPAFSYAVSEDLPDLEAKGSNLVEIEYAPEYMAPYRERRPDWGLVGGFNYEHFYPSGYVAKDNASYDALFGTDQIAMMGLQGGAKLNFVFGSLTAEASFSQGSVAATNNGVTTTMSISKVGGHAGLWLDMLFPEPYVVPYAQFDVAQVDYSDKVDSTQFASDSGSLTMMGYTLGALIQLNWLEPRESLSALASSGLNNTYINLFVSQLQGTDDSRFDTEMSWGAGVKLEF